MKSEKAVTLSRFLVCCVFVIVSFIPCERRADYTEFRSHSR